MKRIVSCLVGIILLSACSHIEQSVPEDNFLNGDIVEKVVFDVLPIKDGDDPETKASAVPSADGKTVEFAWELDDMVGIYPDKGSQIYFKIEDGAGSSSASFDGGGWALKQNSTYVSYCPFVADFFLSRDAIPISFSGQKQVGTTPPFSGSKYVLASAPATSENGVLRFTYNTLNTIINVNATLPAGTYTKASLTVDEPIFKEEGTFSLDNMEIVGTKFSNTLEIELENVTLSEEGTIPIYIMSAPVDLSGKDVVVRIQSSEGKTYKCVKNPSKEYLAGTRYGLTCEMQIDQPNNVIYYTSTDGNIVTPYKTDVFGANIVSNDYVDGQGIITFDGDVTSMGEDAFLYCSKLASITIPESVTTIGTRAFQDCNNLSCITITESLTNIENYAFLGCYSLTSFMIPESIKIIEEGIFKECRSLTSITIPESVTSIGDRAFEDCRSLTSITIPESVTSIGMCAFCDCYSLTGFSFPDSIKSIGDNAFLNCHNLTSIIIPGSVTSIGAYAFDSCSSLNSIELKAITPPSCSFTIFYNVNECPIFVPAQSVEAYKSAQGWNYYADWIQAIPSVPVPEAVDLGLPSGTKWASFNLGASKPEENGDYYAWGEVKPKDSYTWSSYALCEGSNTTLKKYNTEYSCGTLDNTRVLESVDDAAYASLGVNWRIPTNEEWAELTNTSNCDWLWTSQNGTNGYKVISKKTGKWIFLPAAGEFYSTNLLYTDANGYYWSSSLSDDDTPYDANYLLFTSKITRVESNNRCYGFSIRPVYY